MVARPEPLLKTIRLHDRNAWIVISMPDDKTINLAGEWNAHWMDTKLTYEMLLAESWQVLLGAHTIIVQRTGAAQTLDVWT